MITFTIPRRVRRLIKPKRLESTSQWAERAAFIPPEVGAVTGKLDMDFTPYMREVLDALDDKFVELVALQSCAQIAKTTGAICWVGKVIENDPSPVLWVMPDIQAVKEFSKERFQPFIDSCPTLRARKDLDTDRYTLDAMHFDGMWFWFVSSNSAARLASRPVRYIVVDEINKYKQLLGDEADPISLAQRRLVSFDDSKILCTSTPTSQHGAISKVIGNCEEVRIYHVPCPECGMFQELIFPNLKFERNTDDAGVETNTVKNVWYECEGCHCKIEERSKRDMLIKGRWVSIKKPDRRPKSGSRGHHHRWGPANLSLPC